MNSPLEMLSEESTSPLIIDIPSYGFHLLSGSEGEESFNLSLDYEGDESPSQEEIEDYLYHYIKGYALSRWFERVTFGFGVPASVSPIDNSNWAGEKVVKARGGEYPLYFIEDIEDFTLWSALLDGKDILIVYVGDIDLSSEFFPFINQIIDIMREQKEVVFKSKERKEGVGIEKMLLETPMTFAVRKGGTRGVRIDASKIKGNISYKIVDKMYEFLGVRGGRGRMTASGGKLNATKGSTASRVNYALRL